MGIMWPRSSSLEFDDNAELADGALAYFYEAGTSTPKTVYEDGDEGSAHEFPVEADGGRWPAVFIPFGDYKVLITTAGGTTLFSADDIPNPEPPEEGEEADAASQYVTGDYIFMGKNGTRSGAVRCNGRSIGDASSSATERAHADTADLFAFLWDNYADAQAAVSSGRGATAADDFAAHKRIALPDHRSAHIVGFDDMGNSAASLMGSAPVFSGSAILAGSIIGENTCALATEHLAAHVHAISITSGAGSSHTHGDGSYAADSDGAHVHALTAASAASGGAHTHTISTQNTGVLTFVGSGPFATTGAGSNWGPITGQTLGADSGGAHTHTLSGDTDSGGAHTHGVSGTSGAEAAHTHSISGNSASVGSGTAHNIVSRSIPVTVLMKL